MAFHVPLPNKNKFCNEIDADASGFHECPIPVVEVALVFQKLICTTTVKVLIDSGASLNLISQEFVKLLLKTEGPIIKKALGSCKKNELPTVRVASGHRITSLECIDFQLQLAENVISDPVRFFVFKDLPIQAIVGHKTNSQ